ncbi:GerAB/ArcD/ProY family transporter [Cohnella candidum]|uniref:Spore gernimation protein n=1 Tax=Cohnella candidum TaxID=2674991 RepID=A0A3G3JVP1_9BACL|nr:GerAB/ArcD/ProY family transporter [Cohnella candidum]AYQ72296.1 spore gernimation protein [Cohnella candidum]
MNPIPRVHSFCMMFVFLLATAIIFGTPKLVPDVWLVELLAAVPALLLFFLQSLLVSTDRPKGLYEQFTETWGGRPGQAFVLLYAVYFLYIATRNVRDLLEFVMTTLLRTTPPQFAVALFVLLVAYAASGTLRSTGRLSVIILTAILVFFFALIVLLMISKSLELQRLLPFLSEGFLPVAKEAATKTLWFPYGELVVFLVFAHRIGGRTRFRKIGFAAMGSAVIVLTLSDLLQTMTLGMEFQKYSAFGLLDTARVINVEDFITRLDAVVAMIILFGVLVKCAVFLHAGVLGISTVFRGKDQSYKLPLALLIGALSVLVSENAAEHVEEGLTEVVYWLHIPMQFVLPLITVLVMKMRTGIGGKPRESNEPLG